MNRRDVMLRGITKQMLGIEIGPYHQPLVSKRKGFRSVSLDVHDTETLRKNAAADPAISEASATLIDDVDLVGSATKLAEIVEAKGLAGKFDYVISSHNFEHIPDPIRFLQGCEKALKPGGVLSMALPDKRCCFDYFRPLSMTGDIIQAFFEKRDRPSSAQLFQLQALNCRLLETHGESITFGLATDPATIEPYQQLEGSFEQWRRGDWEADDVYRDTHCWALTPASFELMALEIHFLGLTRMGIESVTGTHGCEFYARLVNEKPVPERAAFYERRAELLREIAVASRGKLGEQRIAELQAEIAALKSSRSWKLTAPLRRLRMALR